MRAILDWRLLRHGGGDEDPDNSGDNEPPDHDDYGEESSP